MRASCDETMEQEGAPRGVRMSDALLLNLLGHLEQEWAVVAITADEVAVLRSLGFVEQRGLSLTDEGRKRLVSLRSAS